MNTQITQPLNELAKIRRQNATFRKPFLNTVEMRRCAECGTRTNHHLIDGRWQCIVCVNMERNTQRAHNAHELKGES